MGMSMSDGYSRGKPTYQTLEQRLRVYQVIVDQFQEVADLLGCQEDLAVVPTVKRLLSQARDV